MILYGIPDIRYFWSNDAGFLNQFKFDDSSKIIKFKPVSVHPPCLNDISFWLPTDRSYDSNSFYDLVRECGDDKIEQVELIDVFYNEKKKLTSHCYRIHYRSMERVLSQKEINEIHKLIENRCVELFGVKLR